MEFIGIGDLHLTSATGSGGLASYVSDHDRAVGLAVSRVLAYAKQNGVRNIFFYGDLCQAPRMSYIGQKVLLSILRKDFDFRIILGNHDKFGEVSSDGHSLELIQEVGLPNVHIYEEPTLVSIDGRPVNFLPWPHAEFNPKALNVAHVDVEGARLDSGRAVTKGSTSKATAVVGHIHTSQRVRNTYYSGTLYQTNFGEGSSKFFHHGRYSDGEWEIENIASKPKYTLHSVEVSSVKDLRRFRATLPEKKDKHLIKLILRDGAKITPDLLHDLNVVKTQSVKTDQELALARVSDLQTGSEVEVSSDEFFEAWLDNSTASPELKSKAKALRTSKLKALSK